MMAMRPDIVIAVGMVARYIEKPSMTHWIALKCILQYLKGIINYGLIYTRSDKTNDINEKMNNIILHVHCDADWAGDIVNRMSTSSFVV